jgi:hypothetical protein
MSDEKREPYSGKIYFIILTLFYIILKQTTIFDTDKKKAISYAISYAILIFITQYFVNLNITKELCGSVQQTTAFKSTILPWTLIFGSIVTLLFVFPSWINPFSNTLGYMFAKMSGIETVLTDIFKSRFERATNTFSPAQEALENIYNNKTLLINEINSENYDRFWDSMKESDMFKQEALDDDTLKNKFKGLILLKENIGLMVWYLLSGILSSIVSYNYLITFNCNRNVDEMKQRYLEYKKKRSNNDDNKN